MNVSVMSVGVGEKNRCRSRDECHTISVPQEVRTNEEDMHDLNYRSLVSLAGT